MDRVQKHKSISKEGVKYLRKLGIIEGKRPNIYLSSSVAESLDKKKNMLKIKDLMMRHIRNGLLVILQPIELRKNKIL